MKKTNLKQAHKGVALITAMLMTSMAAILAVSLVADQQLNIRRTSNVLDTDRALVFAYGIESWVVHILARDDKTKDSLDEDWAVVLPPIPVEGGTVAGQIVDMQGLFNINNLVDEEGKRSQQDVTQFNTLLSSLGLSEELTSPIVDWLDGDDEPAFEGGWGAEDDEYTQLQMPYRTANQIMKSPSELMLVKGVTTEIYDQLSPFITALPTRTAINVNTAPAEVLMSLSPDISAATVEAVLAIREETPFEKVEDFLDQDGIPDNLSTNQMISVTSNYFLLDARASYGTRSKVRMYSLLARRNDEVGVVMRSQGVY